MKLRLSLRMPRIVLMVGEDGVIVVPHNIPHATPFFGAANDPRADAEIVAFVARYPQARVSLLADTLAQDYRSEDLPLLNPFDRRKLIKRRLKQAFPAARLTAALRFRKTEKRALLISLHGSNPVFAWAERLRDHLPDISLVPVEGAGMLAKLAPQDTASGWMVLISRERSGGFRQIVTLKGDLVFTRLTPLPAASDDETALLARDIKASLDYLARHGLRDAGELSVFVLGNEETLNQSALESLSLKKVSILSPAKAAQRLGLPFGPAAQDADSDLLYAAHFLTRLVPRLPLMLPDMYRQWRTNIIQTWGLRASLACLGLAGLLTSWNAGDLFVTLYQTERESLKVAQQRHVFEDMRADVAPLTEPLGLMRQALERRRIYQKQSPTPWLGLRQMADALDPNFKIVTVEWNNNDASRDTFFLTFEMVNAPEDRSEAVDSFRQMTQELANAVSAYALTEVRPPYPALGADTVQLAAQSPDDPVGTVTFEGKAR